MKTIKTIVSITLLTYLLSSCCTYKQACPTYTKVESNTNNQNNKQWFDGGYSTNNNQIIREFIGGY